MRAFLALLKDSFRESIDRRSFSWLLAISGLMILFCLGLSFRSEPVERLFQKQLEDLPELRGKSGSFMSEMNMTMGGTSELQPDVSDLRLVKPGDGLQESFAGGVKAVLRFGSPKTMEDFASHWERFQRALHRGGDVEEEADEPSTRTSGGPQEWEDVLRKRLELEGWDKVHVKTLDPREPSFDVAVASTRPEELPGARHVSFLFGVFESELETMSQAELVMAIQYFLADSFVGFIGMIVALAACASFVPSLLQKGTLDLVLSRPIGRPRLLLSKYVGGISFILIVATFVIGGCWLALGVRSGFWNPAFLGSIGFLVAIFAVLYAVAVLFGVLTRSGTLSFILALAVWGVSSAITKAHQAFESGVFEQAGVPFDLSAIESAVRATYLIVPKTADLSALNLEVLSRSLFSESALARTFADRMPDVDVVLSLGTTAAFTVAVLALAVWSFRRRDY